MSGSTRDPSSPGGDRASGDPPRPGEAPEPEASDTAAERRAAGPDGTAPHPISLAEERRILLADLGSDLASRLAALDRLLALAPDQLAELVDGKLAGAITALLGSESRSEQRRAGERIAALLDSSPILGSAIDAALDSARQRLRWGAAWTRGRTAGPPARLWPAAREAMSLDDGDQRWAAAELACALARAHPEVLVEIRRALTDPSPVLRKMSLYCLRDLGVAGLPGIAGPLLDDPDSGVRLAALAAVASDPLAPEASARAVASRLIHDSDPGVRRAAAAALGRMGCRAPEILVALDEAAGAGDPSLARAAATARSAILRASPVSKAR